MPAAAVFAFVAGQTTPPAVFAVGHNGLGLGARVVTVFAFARLVAPGFIALGVQGVAALVCGMRAEEAIARLEGIDCRGRGTSCPDQLAKALKKAL